MTYEEASQFWFGRVNYEQKSPRVGDFKLDRMRHLLAVLGDPHERLRIVHVAGSKGKGSTAAMLASILQHQGFRVGLFTSPHLVAVEERIQVDREPIGKNELAALLSDIRAATPGPMMDELTFFEIGTALGFLHFVRSNVEFAIVEVGLGGRFDSTNVCDPLVAVITSISHDHTQILGDTLGQIAFEKAGIVKPGRPTISGVRHPEARAVIERVCGERGSPLKQLDVDFRYAYEPALIAGNLDRLPIMQPTTWRRRWPEMYVGLIGEHQARNAAVAIAVVEEMIEHGVSIQERSLADGLARVHWPARLEIMSRRPMVLLDCAHNVASAKALAQALTESFPLDGESSARRHLIFGGNRDKDLAGMLRVLAPLFERVYLTGFKGSARCLPPQQLMELAPPDKSIVCNDSTEAWTRAKADARPSDLICVAGSVFLAGELRTVILAG
jgi:dihydrofolate synthase/folylpolyglutamate synthase